MKQTKIEALDTNILLRIVLRDSESAFEKSCALIDDAEDKVFYADPVAIMEVIHVLESAPYYFSRDKISTLVFPIFNYSKILCNSKIFNETLSLYKTHPKLSFNDCYLSLVAKEKEFLPLWTLDKKLSNQSENTKLLK